MDKVQMAIKLKIGRLRIEGINLTSSFSNILNPQSIRQIITKNSKISSFAGLNIRTR